MAKSQVHDAKLKEIMLQEGESVPAFFNAVFGFLSRYYPEKIYNSSQISGEHLINQSFCKWREKYLLEKSEEEKQLTKSNELDIPFVAAEEVIALNVQDGEVDSKPCPKGNLLGNLATEKKADSLPVANGAVKDNYSWTQTIEDVEMRVPVSPSIKKGKQVKVQIEANTVEVSLQEKSMWRTVVSGKLAHNIRAEESVWSLVPGEHVLISLEKKEERWWDRLLSGEDPIDMQKIDAERDFSTLPAEEQEKIRELVWNKQQLEQGKPTSDRLVSIIYLLVGNEQ
ncbi:nudC domain-containing protein 3-like isoform X1 [Macrobrachium rosenbergii]|uniref:nudC domain-containing protein 3-like isoform X1 n=1 Tax=Macrobrachium rosenbergii TaxID=79674 RepID=UPI0034D47388